MLSLPRHGPHSPRLPVLIIGLLLLCCATASTGASPPNTSTGPATVTPKPARVLLVGLDGADWQIAGPLIDAGKLPNLARLRSAGAWGDLRSASPMLSPLLWTSIAT